MRAMTVHELRAKLNARDKDIVMRRPFDEAVKYVSEHYGCDEDSARAYVAYLKGEPGESSTEEAESSETVVAFSGPKKPAREVFHSRYDPLLGKWVLAEDTEEEAGS